MKAKRSSGRPAPGRMVLFSYRGKAVANKEKKIIHDKADKIVTRGKTDAINAPTANEVMKESKIIDYETLLSWHNEHIAAKAIGNELTVMPEYARKQRSLKFIVL